MSDKQFWLERGDSCSLIKTLNDRLDGRGMCYHFMWRTTVNTCWWWMTLHWWNTCVVISIHTKYRYNKIGVSIWFNCPSKIFFACRILPASVLKINYILDNKHSSVPFINFILMSSNKCWTKFICIQSYRKVNSQSRSTHFMVRYQAVFVVTHERKLTANKSRKIWSRLSNYAAKNIVFAVALQRPAVLKMITLAYKRANNNQ